jgi:hypothetical protein
MSALFLSTAIMKRFLLCNSTVFLLVSQAIALTVLGPSTGDVYYLGNDIVSPIQPSADSDDNLEAFLENKTPGHLYKVDIGRLDTSDGKVSSQLNDTSIPFGDGFMIAYYDASNLTLLQGTSQPFRIAAGSGDQTYISSLAEATAAMATTSATTQSMAESGLPKVTSSTTSLASVYFMDAYTPPAASSTTTETGGSTATASSTESTGESSPSPNGAAPSITKRIGSGFGLIIAAALAISL